MITINTMILLARLDERDILRLKVGAIGKVLAVRKLSTDTEQQLLVKFMGKSGPVCVSLSQVTEL